jgi:hypothetical protein
VPSIFPPLVTAGVGLCRRGFRKISSLGSKFLGSRLVTVGFRETVSPRFWGGCIWLKKFVVLVGR